MLKEPFKTHGAQSALQSRRSWAFLLAVRGPCGAGAEECLELRNVCALTHPDPLQGWARMVPGGTGPGSGLSRAGSAARWEPPGARTARWSQPCCAPRNPARWGWQGPKAALAPAGQGPRSAPAVLGEFVPAAPSAARDFQGEISLAAVLKAESTSEGTRGIISGF